MSAKKKKALHDRPTEEIRHEVAFAIRCLTGELLSALQRSHLAARIGHPDLFELQYVLVIQTDLDSLVADLRAAGEHFRIVQSGIEVLAERVKSANKTRRS
jgi:hypothetical protein